MREMAVVKIDDDVESEDKGETHKTKFRKTVAAQQARKPSHRSTQGTEEEEWGRYCLTFDGPDAGVFIRMDEDSMTQDILRAKDE